MVAAPTATPVTKPVGATVASAGVLDVQLTDRPESTLPAESRSVAVSGSVAPTATLAAAGLTVTVATGGGGQDDTARVQPASLPTSAERPRLVRTLTAACPVRKAKPPLRSRSVEPAGVT